MSKRRGAVIYDGLDVPPEGIDRETRESVRAEFGISPQTKIIGMIARVAPAKDFSTLAKAAARIVAVCPDVRFLIMGDCSRGECHGHYRIVKEFLSMNGVDPYFLFTDFRTDVARIIAAMDVFVLSTHTEGLPLVIMEAMAHGKPVVATAVGGIPEIVVDGVTGLLHSHGNSEELSEKIFSLLQDESRAASLAEAGRSFVKARFNSKQLAGSLASLYYDLLGEKKHQIARA